MNPLFVKSRPCFIATQRFYMSPINHSCTASMHLIPQIFYNRDFWLHTILIPCTLFQRLFMTAAPSRQHAHTYMPSERAPHLRTLMAWPDDTFTGIVNDVILAREEVASIANTIAKYEPVWLYATPANVPIAASWVSSSNITIMGVDVDQLWLRDTGPVLVADHHGTSLAGIDFNFNFWGGNFIIPNSVDRTAAERIISHSDLKRISAPITAEGGALEVDGEGTLIATESSLLKPNRNPYKSIFEIEADLRELLGVQEIIWLQGAQGLDITDYHVDLLARFGPNSTTVVLSRPNVVIPCTHPRYLVYEQAKFVLSTSTNAASQPLTIVEIEEAATVPRAEEDVLYPGEAATSYTNFYLVNGAVIVPQFGENRTDEQAVRIMRELFPDRAVEPVMLNWMAWAGGGVHCATQQWPLLPER